MCYNFLLGIFIICLCVTNILADPSICGNWTPYKDEKCVKIVDTNTSSFDEAEKKCSLADNKSHLLTIHSQEEQDFISELVFKTSKIVENVWLELKGKDGKDFKWSDGSNVDFTPWSTGNPTARTGYDCVQMLADSDPPGKWSDITCKKNNIAVCETAPTISAEFLHKILLETRKTFTNFVNNFANNKWMKFELFENTDRKQKAFFIPLNAYDEAGKKSWDDAVNLCKGFGATLIEMDSSDKEFLFLSYLGQLGSQSNRLNSIWLNAHKDSGKWKWTNSGKEVVQNNWDSGYPKNDSGADHLGIVTTQGEKFSKIFNAPKTDKNHIICEVNVDFQ